MSAIVRTIIVTVCVFSLPVRADDPKQRQFEHVFGKAARFSPETIAKVKALPAGEELKVDTNGDGRIDDCSGEIYFPPGSYGALPRPDGLSDLYVQNPGWKKLLLIGNFNSAKYEALVLEVVR